MPRASKRVATLAVLAIAAGGLAACSSTSSNTGSSAAPTAASSSEKPQSGGTLNIVAASGPDHIDTVPAYYTPDYELERVYTRQLVSYPTMPAATTSSAAWTTDTTPVALIVDPALGRFVYTANKLGNSISGFVLNPTTGSLKGTLSGPYPTGDQPSALAAVPHGNHSIQTVSP